MKKISLLLIVVSALLISCSSPYYPEYLPVVSMGTNPSSLTCKQGEGTVSLNIISNVEYTATITEGTDWLQIEGSDSHTFTGSGTRTLVLEHYANNGGKRVAYLVLHAEDYDLTVPIKQESNYADFLEILQEDKDTMFSKDAAGQASRIEVIGYTTQLELRLRTSCLDSELVCESSHPTAISDMRVENKRLLLTVNENNEGQPRNITINVSYTNGWDEINSISFVIRQDYKH